MVSRRKHRRTATPRLDLIGDPDTPASGCRGWPDCQEFVDWIDGLEKLGAYDIDDTVLEEFYYVVDAGMLDHIPRSEKAAPEAYIATDPAYDTGSELSRGRADVMMEPLA